MARTVTEIKNKMLADVASDTTLGSKLTSPSLTALYNLWCYIVAVATNLFEQIQDAYIVSAESLARKTPPANELWIQNKVFKYQYDPSGSPATNVVVINPDFSVDYATVDSNFNIVTLCSVVTAAGAMVSVKVAKGNAVSGYSAITGASFTQLDGYLTQILPAGINHLLYSGNADQVGLFGTVYYENGYAGVIKNNVVDALTAYLQSISISNSNGSQNVNYTGVMKVSELETAIMSAEGVLDVSLTKVTCRADATPFVSATAIYNLPAGINQRQWNTVAGYAIQETTSGQDWLTGLIFSAQTA